MTTMVWVYLAYLIVCIFVTILVARTLRANGPIFMANRETSDPLLKAKTHLTVVGFYLLTLGVIGFALRFGGDANDAKSAIELLSTKIGAMVLVIGVLHFSMVGIFAAARDKMTMEKKYVQKAVVINE